MKTIIDCKFEGGGKKPLAKGLDMGSYWIKSILLYVIYFYQRFISKHKKYQCACHSHLGELSCSAHAVEVLKHQPLSEAMKLIYHRSKKCRSLNQEFSYKQTYSQYGTLAVALVFATGCGGGGESTQTKTTIKGIVYDDPINNATVTIKSLNGTTIGTASTGVDGNYTLQVNEDAIADGYKLSVRGGTMGSQPFVGEMSATYTDDVKTVANITPVTTLIDAIAVDMEGSGEINKRDNAVKKLKKIGMLDDNWNQLTNDYFNLDSIAFDIQDVNGVEAWTQKIKTDISDDEISVSNARSLFPKAHGGIESADVAFSISVFPEEQGATSVNVLPFDENRTSVVKLIDAPSWIEVKDNLIIASPSSDIQAGIYRTQVEVSPDGVIAGRKAEVVVTVLKSVTLVRGTLGANGGKIENEWRDIAISAEAGKLKQDYEITYRASVNAEGGAVFTLKTTPEMPDDEREYLELEEPSSEIIKQNYLSSLIPSEIGARAIDKSSIQERSLKKENFPSMQSECINEWNTLGNDKVKNIDGQTESAGYNDGFEFNIPHRALTATFYTGTDSLSDLTVISQPRLNFVSRKIISKTTKCASMLLGSSQNGVASSGDPVLFVHGYAGGSIGAIDRYWGNFPRLTKELGYAPYGFFWNTNMRFEDAAYELGQAIKEINKKTGKQVHIVAHSYGGVLTRTLMQGLAEKLDTTNKKMVNVAEFNKAFMIKRIATVTTIGSPHSGVFKYNNSVATFNNNPSIIFPDGRDSTVSGTGIEGCASLTCHEAGENFFDLYGKEKYFSIESKEGQIAYNLARTFDDNYPSEIPTNILIGFNAMPFINIISSHLVLDIDDSIGDGLISLAGQRLLPWLHTEHLADPTKGLFFKGQVHERMLGTSAYISSVGEYDGLSNQIYHAIKDHKNIDLGILFQSETYDPLNHVSYNHMRTHYNVLGEINSGMFSGPLKSQPYYTYTEAGLQNCSSAATCKHSTWFYVKNLITDPLNIAKAVTEDRKVIAKAKITNPSTTARALEDSLEGYNVNIFLDGEMLGSTKTNADGTFQLEVEFQPNRTYVLEVYSPESMSSDTAPRAVVLKKDSAATIEETNLNFSDIELVNKTLQQGEMIVDLKNAVTGASVFDYNLTVGSFIYDLVDNVRVLTAQDATKTLPHGLYIVQAQKDGFIGTGVSLCKVNQLRDNSCVVTMMPEGYLATGGLSAVLTWDADPADLDSHVLKYDANNNLLCHTYYSNQSSCGTEGLLDLDDTSSYGPETIKMEQVDANSNYIYAVHHYRGNGSISSTSKAKVTVTFADGTLRTFNAPSSGEGRYWKVFEVKDGKVIPCSSNCLVDDVSNLRGFNLNSIGLAPLRNLPRKVK